MATSDAAVLSQYEALNDGAGVVALPERTLLEIDGADRVNFVHAFCTNDIKRLQPGQGCEAFFTNHQGKTVGHGLIFAQADALVVETTAGQAAGLMQHLERFVISERIEFHDRSREWTELFVGGREGGQRLQAIAGGPVPEALLAHGEATIEGQPVVVRRVGFTRAPGWLVQVDAAAADGVRAALIRSGFVEVGGDVLEMCRLEAGWPWQGRDITDENLPQEINRNDQAISFKKGCYLGQETVARIDALGHVNRLLVGLALNAAEPPLTGTRLSAGEKEVGQLTSVGYSPRLARPIALALVRRTSTAPGTTLSFPGGTAEVIKLPIT